VETKLCFYVAECTWQMAVDKKEKGELTLLKKPHKIFIGKNMDRMSNWSLQAGCSAAESLLGSQCCGFWVTILKT